MSIKKNPEMVEGPYYAGGGEERSDIRDGQPGVNLDLTIEILNADDETPMVGVDVDLWHCNATGHYSGFDSDPDELPNDLSNGQIPTNNDRFLRGRQKSDANGCVRFMTIYPSWYTLRTPHIHLKIFEGGQCNLTTQFYLPEQLTQDIMNNNPDYARKAEQDTHNHTDPVIASTPGEFDNTWIDLEETSDGFIGRAKIYITPGEIHNPIHPPPGKIPPRGGRLHNVPVK